MGVEIDITEVKAEAPVRGGSSHAGAAIPAWCGTYAAAIGVEAPRVGIRKLGPESFYFSPQGEGFEENAGLPFSGKFLDALTSACDLLRRHLLTLH